MTKIEELKSLERTFKRIPPQRWMNESADQGPVGAFIPYVALWRVQDSELLKV